MSTTDKTAAVEPATPTWESQVTVRVSNNPDGTPMGAALFITAEQFEELGLDLDETVSFTTEGGAPRFTSD